MYTGVEKMADYSTWEVMKGFKDEEVFEMTLGGWLEVWHMEGEEGKPSFW